MEGLDELTESAYDSMTPEERARVGREIEALIVEGSALAITDEEQRLLRAFRLFKATMRSDGKVFTWQTRRDQPSSLIV